MKIPNKLFALRGKLSELKQLKYRNFIFLFFAGCINAFGVTVFLAPVNLYDSGISGTSILLSQITGIRVTVADKPLQTAAIGLGRYIEHPERYPYLTQYKAK